MTATSVLLPHTLDERSAQSFLFDTLQSLTVADDALISIALPAPPAAVTRLLAVSREDAFSWEPPRGPAFAGFGTTYRFERLDGEGAESIIRRANALFERLTVFVHPDLVLGDSGLPATASLPGGGRSKLWPSPRCFGGLAFDRSENSGQYPNGWGRFGPGHFILPRWTFERRPSSGILMLNVDAETARQDPLALVEEYARIKRVLIEERSPEHVRRTLMVDPPSREAFLDLVDRIRAGIEAQRFGKVVAARCTRVLSDRVFEPEHVIERLSEQHPGSLKFAFCRGGSTFLGASPELLVAKLKNQVRSEAVAGTMPSSAPDAARLLSKSEKEQEEHAFVVEHLVRGLELLGCRLDRSRGPEIRRLGEIVHLVTAITGQLNTSKHVLELADALHPSPAVCGTPTQASLEFIRQHEGSLRGWYAGPIGWFDGQGDGEFWVALRSGLITDREALLFAGAGIVLRSDPAAEYAETNLKLRTLMMALEDA